MRRARWIFALLWAALLIAGLSRLKLDVQVLNLLPTEIPSVEALKIYEDHFGKADELIITLRGNDPEALEQAAKNLSAELRSQTNLVRQAQWQPPWQENPGETGELLAYMWLNADPAEVQALAARLAPAQLPAALDQLKAELATTFSPQDLIALSYDPLQLGKVGGASAFDQASPNRSIFSSDDGGFRLLFVESARPLRTFPECRAWLDEIQNIVTNSTTSGVESVGYTGRPAFVAEISEGMESDVSGSVGGTAIVIAILFWLAHRSFKPLVMLLLSLGLVLLTMLALGGLFYGSLNVVSLGFAAILLGLGVDYALLIYQERVAAPGDTAQQLRAHTAPGILWSAITTSCAFALLNLAGLPGLSQLGSLIAIGVVVAAAVMVWLFLPAILRVQPRVSAPPRQNFGNRALPIMITAGALILTTIILARGLPRMDTGTEALRPSDTPAYDAMEAVKTNITREADPFWLIVRGPDKQAVSASLAKVQQNLVLAQTAGVINSFDLAATIFPNRAHETANRPTLRAILQDAEAIHETLLSDGFEENSWTLTSHVLAAWRKALTAPAPFQPISGLSRWVLDRTVAITPERAIALGAVRPAQSGPEWAKLKTELQANGALVAGWQELGRDLFGRVRGRVPLVLGAILLVSMICLWRAFGSWREVLLSWATLLFSLWCLLALMKLANWSWNLMNMVALPLLIGAGVDYTIHVQLALKRERGSLPEMWRKVGRALLLSAGSTIAGFGSLYFAGNAGLASLGVICATGLVIICFTSIYLLPAWWLRLHPQDSHPSQ